METLKYTIIKTEDQYNRYCNMLESLMESENAEQQEEIELLTLLIEQWDKDNNTFSDSDPVQILQYMMQENQLKVKDLVDILSLSKGTVSKILNYQKGLSKETIRKLAEYFQISQEAFNRPYYLETENGSVNKKTGKG